MVSTRVFTEKSCIKRLLVRTLVNFMEETRRAQLPFGDRIHSSSRGLGMYHMGKHARIVKTLGPIVPSGVEVFFGHRRIPGTFLRSLSFWSNDFIFRYYSTLN